MPTNLKAYPEIQLLNQCSRTSLKSGKIVYMYQTCKLQQGGNPLCFDFFPQTGMTCGSDLILLTRGEKVEI